MWRAGTVLLPRRHPLHERLLRQHHPLRSWDSAHGVWLIGELRKLLRRQQRARVRIERRRYPLLRLRRGDRLSGSDGLWQ